MIFYISPYSSERPPNITGAIQKTVSKLKITKNDWIVLTDQDICFLLPDTKKHVEHILNRTGDSLLGCMTNRCNIREQLFFGEIYSGGNMREHEQIAEYAWNDARYAITPAPRDIAGFFMAFKKELWDKVYPVIKNEKQYLFDRYMCRVARQHNYTIGIMQGIYVYHHYRLSSDDPVNKLDHLI